FVQLSNSGADGLVPISTLPDDFYHHDEAGHRLVGRRWGRIYRLGETVAARLSEADPITGGIVLRLLEDDEAGDAESGGVPVDEAGDTGAWHPLKASRRKSSGGDSAAPRKKTTRRSGGKPGRRKGRSR
ncbi:MAG: ribonuclease R, partial [Rhodospirillales bacterium]|nr:ribonuclease R [Rhodospirillales bacterium]